MKEDGRDIEVLLTFKESDYYEQSISFNFRKFQVPKPAARDPSQVGKNERSCENLVQKVRLAIF